MVLIIVLAVLWVLAGGLSKFKHNSPLTHEDIARESLKGFENTQYYKDQIEFSRKLDSGYFDSPEYKNKKK